MKMTAVQVEIETVLRRLGGSGVKDGFWLAVYGVTLVLEDPTVLTRVTKRLYPAIGEEFGLSSTAVRRDLKLLVEDCWAKGDREALCRLAGRRLLEEPTVGEFLDYVAACLRRRGV